MLKNYSRIKVDESGDKRYLNDEGQLHRLDGPAVEYSDGTRHWFINGNRHRKIDPTIEYVGEKNNWWLFINKHHRVGGPSNSVYSEWWYIHDKEYTKLQYFNKVWDI